MSDSSDGEFDDADCDSVDENGSTGSDSEEDDDNDVAEDGSDSETEIEEEMYAEQNEDGALADNGPKSVESKDGDNAECNKNSDGEGEVCPICLNHFIGQELGMPEGCEHIFCFECIDEWSKNTNTCPLDRIEINEINVKLSVSGDVINKVKVEVRPREPEDALPEDTTACEVCHMGDREDRLLLCDSCDLAYHCECLNPPLRRIPIIEWFCPPCSAILSKSRRKTPSSATPRRVIPRTIVSETVRSRIQSQRINNTGLTDTTNPSPSTSRARTPAVPKKRKPVRRKYRRRRIVRPAPKLARTKKTAAFGKGKTRAATETRVVFRKRRRRRRKRYIKRKTTTSGKTRRAHLASKPLVAPTARKRIAGVLGLVRPPPGHAMPDAKKSSGRSQNIFNPSFSLFGSRNQLMDFDENYVDEPPQSSSTSSQPNVPQCSVSPVDLLGTILSAQKLLYEPTKDIQIGWDGSLKVNKPVQSAKAKVTNVSYDSQSSTKREIISTKLSTHNVDHSSDTTSSAIKRENASSKPGKSNSVISDSSGAKSSAIKRERVSSKHEASNSVINHSSDAKSPNIKQEKVSSKHGASNSVISNSSDVKSSAIKREIASPIPGPSNSDITYSSINCFSDAESPTIKREIISPKLSKRKSVFSHSSDAKLHTIERKSASLKPSSSNSAINFFSDAESPSSRRESSTSKLSTSNSAISHYSDAESPSSRRESSTTTPSTGNSAISQYPDAKFHTVKRESVSPKPSSSNSVIDWVFDAKSPAIKSERIPNPTSSNSAIDHSFDPKLHTIKREIVSSKPSSSSSAINCDFDTKSPATKCERVSSKPGYSNFSINHSSPGVNSSSIVGEQASPKPSSSNYAINYLSNTKTSFIKREKSKSSNPVDKYPVFNVDDSDYEHSTVKDYWNKDLLNLDRIFCDLFPPTARSDIGNTEVTNDNASLRKRSTDNSHSSNPLSELCDGFDSRSVINLNDSSIFVPPSQKIKVEEKFNRSGNKDSPCNLQTDSEYQSSSHQLSLGRDKNSKDMGKNVLKEKSNMNPNLGDIGESHFSVNDDSEPSSNQTFNDSLLSSNNSCNALLNSVDDTYEGISGTESTSMDASNSASQVDKSSVVVSNINVTNVQSECRSTHDALQEKMKKSILTSSSKDKLIKKSRNRSEHPIDYISEPSHSTGSINLDAEFPDNSTDKNKSRKDGDHRDSARLAQTENETNPSPSSKSSLKDEHIEKDAIELMSDIHMSNPFSALRYDIPIGDANHASVHRCNSPVVKAGHVDKCIENEGSSLPQISHKNLASIDSQSTNSESLLVINGVDLRAKCSSDVGNKCVDNQSSDTFLTSRNLNQKQSPEMEPDLDVAAVRVKKSVFVKDSGQKTGDSLKDVEIVDELVTVMAPCGIDETSSSKYLNIFDIDGDAKREDLDDDIVMLEDDVIVDFKPKNQKVLSHIKAEFCSKQENRSETELGAICNMKKKNMDDDITILYQDVKPTGKEKMMKNIKTEICQMGSDDTGDCQIINRGQGMKKEHSHLKVEECNSKMNVHLESSNSCYEVTQFYPIEKHSKGKRKADSAIDAPREKEARMNLEDPNMEKTDRNSFLTYVESIVKTILKPYYVKGDLNKEQYKDVMRRCVPKIMKNSAKDVINVPKVQQLVLAYLTLLTDAS